MRAAVLAVAVSLTVAGCGEDGGLGEIASKRLPPTLVGSDASSVLMIQTESRVGGTFIGTYDVTEADEDYFGFGEPVDFHQGGVSGTVGDGGRVIIRFEGQIGAESARGTLKGSTLTVHFREDDGEFSDFVLKPGSEEKFSQISEELRLMVEENSV